MSPMSSAMAAAGSKPTGVAKDGTVAQLALENQPKGVWTRGTSGT